jgi:uncharacterized protein YacL
MTPSNIALAILAGIVFVAYSKISRLEKELRRLPRAKNEGSSIWLLDTSVLIDGRIFSIVDSFGVQSSDILLPSAVLGELKSFVDSKEARYSMQSRKAREALNRLSRIHGVRHDIEFEEKGADDQLLLLATKHRGRLVSLDNALCKTANLRGIKTINIDTFAEHFNNTTKVGDILSVDVSFKTQIRGQAIGLTRSGSFVVIQGGSKYLGKRRDVQVTSIRQQDAFYLVETKLV